MKIGWYFFQYDTKTPLRYLKDFSFVDGENREMILINRKSF